VFQSTHPRGVRPWAAPRCRKSICCFNPRTREGCDLLYIPCPLGYGGFNPRTREGCDFKQRLEGLPMGVSIHAPARGATPTTRPCRLQRPVSIHAPARGATMASIHVVIVASSFNPRTREGCDSNWLSAWGVLWQFQSTHPRGVRRGVGEIALTSFQFQSTHPRGVRR